MLQIAQALGLNAETRRTAEDAELEENEIGRQVLGCALTVHRALGPAAFAAVIHDGLTMELAYRLDLLVLKRVVVEVKAIETIAPVHNAQVLSYLRLGGFRLGYLLNFNVALMKDGIFRIANGL
jgi:hypothetical protein